MRGAARQTWVSGEAKNSLRASSGLVNSVCQVVGAFDGVKEVRVLHREGRMSKFFIVLTTPSLSVVERVVDAMVQVEDAFAGEGFDYDTVPSDKAVLIPADATATLNG